MDTSIKKIDVTIDGCETPQHLKKLKKEVIQIDDEPEHRQEEAQMSSRIKIRYPSLEVNVEMSSKAYEKSKAKKKRHVELNNIDTKRSKKTSSEEIRDECMERAKELQAALHPKFPSFIKLMVQSHVSGSFLMSIPKSFSRQHMLNQNKYIVFEGENRKKYIVTYLEKHPAFSAGWKKVACDHKLQVNDVVLFQLLSPCKFKVHIFRCNTLADQTAKQRNLKANVDKVDDVESLNESNTCNNARDNLSPKIVHDTSCLKVDSHTDSLHNADESFVDFVSFTLKVDGFDIDSEVSQDIRRKYYELCLSKKTYLHDHLRKTIKPIVAAGLISETVEIENAIQGSQVFMSQDDFVDWDKTLEGFVSLGMDVEFLRSRLKHLMKLALQSKQTPEFKKYKKARIELTRLDEDIKTQETSLDRLKQTKNDVEVEIRTMKANVQRYNLKFQKVASAAW